MLTMIAAVGANNEIGVGNDLVWRLPSDMKFFRETTTGHTIIMGRKTFESFDKPLPNRKHVVLSTFKDYFCEGAQLCNSFEQIIAKYKDSKEEHFIIGGAQIYSMFMPYVDKMYLTHIDAVNKEADVFFPHINQDDWDISVLHSFFEKDIHYEIRQYIRK